MVVSATVTRRLDFRPVHTDPILLTIGPGQLGRAQPDREEDGDQHQQRHDNHLAGRFNRQVASTVTVFRQQLRHEQPPQ